MVQAKAAGRSRWLTFEPGMLKAAVSRLDLVSGLRTALEEGQFRLHYQPIVDLKDGRLRSVEALARWEHPERGLILPGEFIHATEESGLILPLGRLVLRESLRQLRDWLDHGAPKGFGVSVNLSPRQLDDPELFPTLTAALEQHAIPPSSLQLEVTESVLMNNRQGATQVLSRLVAMGISIAIDDFGTGYSSLSYLHQFPAEALKIDRAFIARMDGLPENEAVTSAVIMLGHKLGRSIVAEGIETELQAGRLRAMGCDKGQGYLFAKPQPPEAIPAFWRKPFNLPAPLEEKA
jgi:EAL domain-containing protein (putative c-di-GMP-specific phosphodiesterase class I)